MSGSKLVWLCVHEIKSYINQYLPVPHLKEPCSLHTENEKNASHEEIMTALWNKGEQYDEGFSAVYYITEILKNNIFLHPFRSHVLQRKKGPRMKNPLKFCVQFNINIRPVYMWTFTVKDVQEPHPLGHSEVPKYVFDDFMFVQSLSQPLYSNLCEMYGPVPNWLKTQSGGQDIQVPHP